MVSDDHTKLLNDLDVKEIFERQSDARSAETVALGITTLLASVVALTLVNSGIAGGSGYTVVAVLFVVGLVAHWMSRIFLMRIDWLATRAAAANARLAVRSDLPEAYRGLHEHQAFEQSAVVATLQSRRMGARLRVTSLLSPVALLAPTGNSAVGLAILLLLAKIIVGF